MPLGQDGPPAGQVRTPEAVGAVVQDGVVAFAQDGQVKVLGRAAELRVELDGELDVWEVS